MVRMEMVGGTCVCVCICVSVYVCLWMYVIVCIVRMYVCAFVRMSVCVCVNSFMCLWLCVNLCECVSLFFLSVCVLLCICLRKCIHLCIHTDKFMYLYNVFRCMYTIFTPNTHISLSCGNKFKSCNLTMNVRLSHRKPPKHFSELSDLPGFLRNLLGLSQQHLPGIHQPWRHGDNWEMRRSAMIPAVWILQQGTANFHYWSIWRRIFISTVMGREGDVGRWWRGRKIGVKL